MQYPSTPELFLTEARRFPDQRRARFSWSDGASAELTYDLLQGYCPCAHCRGHDGGDIVYQKPAQEVRSIDLAPVGNYALSIVFSPGCSAGIFPFDFLREMARREQVLTGEPS